MLFSLEMKKEAWKGVGASSEGSGFSKTTQLVNRTSPCSGFLGLLRLLNFT